MNSPPTHHQPNANPFAEYPALAHLRLDEGDLLELARQGSVAPEPRNGRTRYKLRFRRHRQQVVRLVGGPDDAALIKQELAKLQCQRRLERELTTAASPAGRCATVSPF